MSAHPARRVHLETERLTLRAFTLADADALVALDGDPVVMRWLTGGVATPREEIARRILPGFIAASACGDGYGVWAAESRATGEFLGWFAFRPTDGATAQRGEVSLGYRLRRAVWGQGYATEGARALIHQGFRESGVQRVVATTYQENQASRRVLEKAGLRLIRRYRPTPAELAASATFVPGGEVWDGDDLEYAITRAEWERQVAAEEARDG